MRFDKFGKLKLKISFDKLRWVTISFEKLQKVTKSYDKLR